ncbi:hypothetical protein E2562_020538 [Oryza meyeriana var. granulata]|uniref:Uncharacterized protein n=1 Tax=Oryza meyeriana var. granulata TaxID=110450 RepID=A0A6G1EAX4_9ORYZ|nr:hypothetical protein E2562_020538 [Oryza meyeriana var. granulata]
MEMVQLRSSRVERRWEWNSSNPVPVCRFLAACRLIVVVAWFRSNRNEEQRGPAASSPAEDLSSCRRTFHSQIKRYILLNSCREVVMHTEDEATWTMQTKAKTKPPTGLKTKTMLATWIKDETLLASDIEANMTPATRIKDGRRPAN